MKKLFFLFILIAAIAFLAVLPVQAQMSHTPKHSELMYKYQIAANKSYAASQIDTSTTLQVGAADKICFQLVTKDSCEIDFYVDYKLDSLSTWTNGLTDSLKTTTNTGTAGEFIFRCATAEKYTGMHFGIRTRSSFRATKNGTTSARYYLEMDYK